MRPTSVEFVDTILSAGSSELLLEDVTIPPDSGWSGKALQQIARVSDDVMILALKRGASMLFRPSDRTILEPGDELVLAGPPGAIRAVEAVL